MESKSFASGDPWLQPGFPVELLDPVEMGEADRLAGETVPSRDLMRHAGGAVANLALELLSGAGAKPHVRVLCGPGNNGGDGYVAAALLAEAGCAVSLAAFCPRTALKGDAAWAASLWQGPIDPLDAALDARVDMVIDGLFGAGLARDIEGPAAAAIERLNAWAGATRRPVVAIDVPSGLDGGTGRVRGVAVRATHTITFFRLKPGHVLLPGRVLCGRIALADIGIPASVLERIRPPTALNLPGLWAPDFPVPRLEGHKYGRGHAVVVSGPPAQTGAARLAARGALRAGAGLVTVATPEAALPIHAASLTAVMTRVADSPGHLAELLADARKNAVVLGPGLGVGEETRARVRIALASQEGPARHVVLDADALASFADHQDALFAAIRAGKHAVVLTPHDGEFSKLFGPLLDVSAAKVERTRAAARLSGAHVVLKGADTCVAAPDGRVAIAASDAPWLATAGSGDVLAGMIAGYLAQGVPAFKAAAMAVWCHAEAGRLFGPGLISEDLPEMLPSVLRNLLDRHGIGQT